ncbi:MAG: SDR family NAD(P)-dependent oxidoreductase [Desulfurococcaceae archaeon]|nr:SDR family NAD(P)-dependent oxidoreductase [Desulfurococcaceae archaeon]
MKMLVTGGAGFIGSHLVDRLVDEGYKVRVVDNLSSGRTENLRRHIDSNAIELLIGDLKDPQIALRSVENVDMVFHFAANPEVRVSSIDPETHFNENIVATFNLLEAMRKRNVREIVFASSSSVYGEPDEIPVDENAPIKPVSVYGASKASCETLIHAYSKLYKIKAVLLRYANVVGPRLRHGVIWDLINKLIKNPRELEILGDGRQIRSYIYIDDAIEATMIAWRKTDADYEIYNIGNEDWITVDEVADEILKTMKLKDVKKIYKPILHGVGWPGDVKRVALKIDKIKRLGFSLRMNSRYAVEVATENIIKEMNS